MCDCLAKMPNNKLFFEDLTPSTQCVICLDHIHDTNKTVLSCGHELHSTCYSENILSGNNKCPLCRENVCKKVEQLPDVSKTMTAIFMEQMLLSDKGEQITTLFKELGYQENEITKENYESVIHLLLKFGFNLGYIIRKWVSEGNDRYVNDNENYIIESSVENMIPDTIPLRDSDTESLSSLESMEHDIIDADIEPINLLPLFHEENDDPFMQNWEDTVEYIETRNEERLIDFIQEYNLENYRERLVNDEELSDFGRLLSCDIEDIMSPGGLSNTHSLFTRVEAEDIFTAILSYYAKIYDDDI